MAVFNSSYASELFVLTLNAWEGDNAVEYVTEKDGSKKTKKKRNEFQVRLKKYLKDSLQKITFKGGSHD